MDWMKPTDLPFLNTGKRLLPATSIFWNDNTQRELLGMIERIAFTRYGIKPDITVKPFYNKRFPDLNDFMIARNPKQQEILKIVQECLDSFARGY